MYPRYPSSRPLRFLNQRPVSESLAAYLFLLSPPYRIGVHPKAATQLNREGGAKRECVGYRRPFGNAALWPRISHGALDQALIWNAIDRLRNAVCCHRHPLAFAFAFSSKPAPRRARQIFSTNPRLCSIVVS